MRRSFWVWLMLVLLGCALPAAAHAVELDEDNNGAVDVGFGGTNAVTAAGARTSLGVAPSAGHYLTDQAESGLSAEVVVSADGKALVTAADYAAMRVLLGVGASLQAWDADLDTYATITPSANVQSLMSAADYAAILDLLDLTTADLLASLAVDDLNTLSGVAAGAQSLGSFTGSTITDNVTIKAALQELETALETTAGDVTSVLDDTAGAVPVLVQAATAFADADATPDISGHSTFITANTGATTITDFDWGGGAAVNGTIIWVIVNDALTTFDFTSSGLEGSASDYTANDGEVLQFIYSTVDNQWHFLGFPKTLSNVTIAGGTANRSAYWNASGNLTSRANVEILFPLCIQNPTSAHDDIKQKMPNACTITAVYAHCVGGTSVEFALYEVDSDANDADAVQIDDGNYTATTTQLADTTISTNATLDAGDWLQYDTVAVTDSVTMFCLTVWGYWQ